MEKKFKIPTVSLTKEDLQSEIVNYKQNKCNISIEKIVSHYSCVITGVSKKYIHKVDEDLLGDCLILLLESIKKYDLSKGTSFKTYFNNRLIGHIRDYINVNYYYRNKLSKKAIKRFTKLKNLVKHEKATIEEINEYHAIKDRLDNVNIVENQNIVEHDLDENIAVSDLMTKIGKVLSDKDYYIFKSYNFDHLNFRDIADVLGVSKQSVAKRYRKALEVIRETVKLY